MPQHVDTTQRHDRKGQAAGNQHGAALTVKKRAPVSPGVGVGGFSGDLTASLVVLIRLVCLQL
jgi:4-diphosphocytidyl-2C-methyl-D-erythritol kinase